MPLPQSNACLTKITARTSEDYDYEGLESATVWTGSVDAYFSHTSRMIPNSDTGGLDRNAVDTLVIDWTPVLPDPGESVTFTHEGATVTRRVQDVAVRPAVGVLRRTAKLYLESD